MVWQSFCPEAVIGRFICSTVVIGLPYHPKTVIWLLLRWGLLCPSVIQLLHSGASITDCPGRSREGGSHPWVLEHVFIMWISCGSLAVIAIGSQVKLPHRGSNDQQVPVLSFCSRQWGGTSSHVFLSNRGSGVGSGFHKILSLNWQWQHVAKQGGLGPLACGS